jgi:hypothetical protein
MRPAADAPDPPWSIRSLGFVARPDEMTLRLDAAPAGRSS